jgi:hypothetical protein
MWFLAQTSVSSSRWDVAVQAPEDNGALAVERLRLLGVLTGD